MINLDEIDTVPEETLVTLDDEIHGFEGKYVGKKEIKGSSDEEKMYRVYFKPPESIIKSIGRAVLGKVGKNNSGVEQYPEKIPESGLQEMVSTSTDVNHPAKPDKKTVLRHREGNTAPYSDEKGDNTNAELRSLRQEVKKWKQKAKKAKREKTEAENQADLDDDTKNRRTPHDRFGSMGEY